MDTSTSTKTKPTSSPRDAAQAFRETAENGVANAKAAYEKTNAVAAEATTMMKDSYAKSVKGAQDYQMKAIEFARTNTEAAFEFAQKLTSVKSPSSQNPVTSKAAAVRTSASVSLSNLTKVGTSSDLVISGRLL